jgi:hypothetical protein
VSLSVEKQSVAIISAYGRGDLLATELKARGFDVTLVDVSNGLVKRSYPDLEGPFPVARPNPILPAHLEWLMTQSFDEITNGFCVWLKNGPIELRGKLSTFYTNKVTAVAEFRQYVEQLAANPSKKNDLSRRLEELKFDDRWLIELSHTFACNELRALPECHRSGEPFPFHQTLDIPIFNEANATKVQSELKASGIRLMETEGVSDVQVERGSIKEIELNIGRKEALECRYYVWCLSSEETEAISKKVAEKLFTRGPIHSDWAWRRFQVHSGKSAFDAVVPKYLLMVDDIHFPWVSDNMTILKRRKPELADLWVRLPSVNSRKPDQLKGFTEKLDAMLKDRFPRWSMRLEAPWDEGPPLYPVFEPETKASFGKVKWSNFVFEGPEVFDRLDWAGRFQKQSETLARLLALRNQDLAKAAKAAKKDRSDDQALHAP